MSYKMTKTPINYSNTIIYKLVCKNVDIVDVYIGHTTNFIKRRNQHKTACNNPNDKGYNYKVYTYMRDNGGWDDWLMVLV